MRRVQRGPMASHALSVLAKVPTARITIDPGGTVQSGFEPDPARHLALAFRERVPVQVEPAIDAGGALIWLEQNTVLAKWDVRRITRQAAAALEEALNGMPAEYLVILCYRFGAWRLERFTERRNVLHHFERLQDLGNVIPLPTTKIEPLDPDSPQANTPLFRAVRDEIARRWRLRPLYTLTGGSRLEHLTQWGMQAFHDAGDDTIRVSYVGGRSTTVQMYGQDWARRAIGEPLGTGVTSLSFENRICSGYRHVLETGRPRHDRITGWFEAEGSAPIWVDYSRMIAPLPRGGAEPSMLVFTELTPSREEPVLLGL